MKRAQQGRRTRGMTNRTGRH